MTKRWASFLIGAATMFIMVNWCIDQELSIQTIAITGTLVIESAVLWHYDKRKQFSIAKQSLYRSNVSSGILNVLLVPMALMGELCTRKESEDYACLVNEMWLSLMIVFIIIVALTVSDEPYYHQPLLLAISSFGAVWAMLYDWIYLIYVAIFCLIWECFEFVPRYLPKSFTFGELAVILQLFASWFNRIVLSMFQEQTLSKEDIQLTWFVCILVMAVMIATIIVCVISAYSSLWHFVAVYTVLAAISLIILQAALNDNAVLWLLNFAFGNFTKVMLLGVWMLLLAMTIVWTIIQGLKNLNISRDTSSEQYSQNNVNTDHMAGHDIRQDYSSSTMFTTSFLIRKVFHVFIVLVYFPGLVLDIRLLLFASTAVFSLLIILEAARGLHVPIVGENLDQILRTFVDDRDQGLVFLTHIYLLVGMSLPLWISHNLFSSHTAPLQLYSGLLSLGVGDTVACVAGTAWGRIYWPGSKKLLKVPYAPSHHKWY